MATGLRFGQGITAANLSGAGISMTFEPSMVISAAKVNKLSLSLRSFRDPLKKAIKEVMIPSIHKNFVVSGRPKWVPLAEDTLQMRKFAPGLGYVAKPLIRTGALMKTMEQQNIWHIDAVRATLANLPEKVWYGVVHQAGYGGGSGSTKVIRSPLTGRVLSNVVEAGAGMIPARPFVVIQKEDEAKIDLIFQEWLAAKIKLAGL